MKQETQYPLWLNIASGVSMILVVIGFVVASFGIESALFAAAGGWFGVWMCGEIAAEISGEDDH